MKNDKSVLESNTPNVDWSDERHTTCHIDNNCEHQKKKDVWSPKIR